MATVAAALKVCLHRLDCSSRSFSVAVYPQVDDKSHWNSRGRGLQPEELSFSRPATSDIEMGRRELEPEELLFLHIDNKSHLELKNCNTIAGSKVNC